MANLSTAAAGHRQIDTAQHTTGAWLRSVVIGLTAFLTVVDLFATQAILPSLARAYNVSPAAMGFAVNASTIGMAIVAMRVRSVSSPLWRIVQERGPMTPITIRPTFKGNMKPYLRHSNQY